MRAACTSLADVLRPSQTAAKVLTHTCGSVDLDDSASAGSKESVAESRVVVYKVFWDQKGVTGNFRKMTAAAATVGRGWLCLSPTDRPRMRFILCPRLAVVVREFEPRVA